MTSTILTSDDSEKNTDYAVVKTYTNTIVHTKPIFPSFHCVASAHPFVSFDTPVFKDLA